MDQLEGLIRRCEAAVCFDLLGGRSSADVAKKIREQASILQFFDAGQIIAFVSFYANMQPNGFGFINMVCVDPEHQGRGLAQLLVGATCHAVKAAGFEQIRLEVSIHNAAGIGLYSKLGFREFDRKGASLFMARTLGSSLAGTM